MKKMNRICAFLMALLLIFSMPVSTLAATYYLENGDINIHASSGGQAVTQGSNTNNDDNPVITQKDTSTPTSNTISISSTPDSEANVTIKDVNIDTGSTESGIDIADGSNVNLHISGDNTIANGDDDYGTSEDAAIHVGDANLTIQGDGTGKSSLDVTSGAGEDDESYSAAVGSNENEDFDGSITIRDITIDAYTSDEGAGIGSGEQGDFNGSVTIEDARIDVESETDGAAIGSGDAADFNGTIGIYGSDVYANGDDEGAGIGAGEGGDFNGTVIIQDSNVHAENDEDAAGIGAGDEGDFNGTVAITDSTVIAESGSDGIGIGAGDNGTFSDSGKVIIHNSDVTLESSDENVSIGSDDDESFNGTIIITGNSTITMDELLGSEYLEESNGLVAIGSNVVIQDSEGNIRNHEDVVSGAEYMEIEESALSGHELETLTDRFWLDVLKQIKQAKAGDQITVDAGSRTTMPYYIMDAIGEYGVTLIVQWDGGEDITINKAYVGETHFWVYQLSELPALLKG